ncbi:MAG: PKD domain-containing protein [Holophagales bacterium]|nr:PKD domain-containing protein [Holophagales bacterium]MYF94156.1 PKD domain-containing protein [Holophagales bacterium]
MARGRRFGTRLLPAIVYLIAAVAAVAAAGAQGSEAGDREALTTLYNATGGMDWEYGTNWLSAAPLGDWYGIETDAHGRVVVVSLTRNGLSGPIPAALGSLDRLEQLWLTANRLTGAIPQELGDLAALEVLSLAVNELTGSIPSTLQKLTDLEQLNLNDNRLDGSIPPGLGGLPNLVDLSLNDNGLTGPLSLAREDYGSLQWLDFSGNALTDAIPSELGGLSGLLRLSLGRNRFSGEIPRSLGDVSRLRELDLAANRLTGAVPDEIANLHDLESLYLNGNAALGGPMPLALRHLPVLGFVDILGTGLCAPEDALFRAWVVSIEFWGCGGRVPPPPPSPSAGGSGGGGGSPNEGADEDDGEGREGNGNEGGGGATGIPPRAMFAPGRDCAEGLCHARTGQPVTLTDASSGTVRFRTWDFGDGTQSRSRQVSHRWREPGFYEVRLWVSDGANESAVSLTFLVEASTPAGNCVADPRTRCLLDSRYSATVDWWAPDGREDAGRVVHAGTNDSGLFRFFSEENWEVLVKVLDACSLNRNVWVFAASTTNLGHSIRIRDTVTGEERVYRNEPGQSAPAITDVAAFPAGCAAP